MFLCLYIHMDMSGLIAKYCESFCRFRCVETWDYSLWLLLSQFMLTLSVFIYVYVCRIYLNRTVGKIANVMMLYFF